MYTRRSEKTYKHGGVNRNECPEWRANKPELVHVSTANTLDISSGTLLN